MLSILEDIEGWNLLAALRTNDFSESIDPYYSFANLLEATNRHNYITRAAFIREQCNGLDGKELFDKYRENWEINDFEEDLISAEDFKRGFLWRFRDHTTSWSDNQNAKDWFLTSAEAWFVRRYEFWSCDKGYNECIDVREGSYKEILLSLLEDGDYQVLSSPAFTKSELEDFIKNYKPIEGDFTIEEIIEDYIEINPNYEV